MLNVWNQSIKFTLVCSLFMTLSCGILGKEEESGESTPPVAENGIPTPDMPGETLPPDAPPPALLLAPLAWTMQAQQTKSFVASEGLAPFSFSIVSGAGSIDGSGVFTAAELAGTTVVRVTDAAQQTMDAVVTIVDILQITPSLSTVASGNSMNFQPSGGTPPYAFSLVSGVGTLDNLTGAFTAGTSGNVTVELIDGNFFTVEATITVVDSLAITPSDKTLMVNQAFTFTHSGGVAPFTYTIESGTGSINAATGEYTAPSSIDSAVVRVTDALSNISESQVTVVAALTISPLQRTIAIDRTVSMTAAGGVPPYTYSIVSGLGSIDSTTGSYTSPNDSTDVVVRVTDSLGNTSNGSIDVIKATQLAVGGSHTCVLFDNGGVKCWGSNASGQLGYGDLNNRGDAANEMFENLPFVSLGTGRSALKVRAGESHTCALLDNNSIKCWGLNGTGQLGLGTTTTMGDGASEMGDSLPAIDLGTGITAIDLSAGQQHTCALLSTFEVKCWGQNNYGQLGIGSTVRKGDNAGEMGNALPKVNLGTGRTALKISAGYTHTCALLDNETLKCWGRSNYGQLGLGNTTTMGDAAAEMGNGLPAISLGTGKIPTEVTAGQLHTCARFTDATTKCWGRSNVGQLGQNNTTTLGTSAAQMGNALPVVNLGSFTVQTIISMTTYNCTLLNTNDVKCWGQNTYGQLGIGSTTTKGDSANEMGANLPVLSLGTGKIPMQIGTGISHSCALFTDRSVKCWGRANLGQTGQGNTTSLGTSAAQMGNALPIVQF